MSDFVIQDAERKAIPVLIGLYGLSGSGKTLSGLKLARGLAGPTGKIGVIDTENGRAQIYAGREEIGDYVAITLTEPFAPKRFTDAVIALESANCDVIVVDSISAEWEGPGGVLDMADKERARSGKMGLHVWNAPKMAHRGMMQRLTRSPTHLIFCCRGKEEIFEAKDENGKKAIVKGDIIAIQDKSFIYEMTLHMRLTAGSNVPVVTKCLDELRPFIDERAPLTVETGTKIAEWVNNGAEIDARQRALHAEATTAAQDGPEALKAFFEGMDPKEKPLLKAHVNELRAAARTAEWSRPEPDTEDAEEAERERIAREAFAETGRLAREDAE